MRRNQVRWSSEWTRFHERSRGLHLYTLFFLESHIPQAKELRSEQVLGRVRSFDACTHGRDGPMETRVGEWGCWKEFIVTPLILQEPQASEQPSLEVGHPMEALTLRSLGYQVI